MTNNRKMEDLMETDEMSLSPTKNTSHDTRKKCHHHDKGYCKHKNKCIFYHPIKDHVTEENVNRHRKECRYGKACYHNKNEMCEFLHLENIYKVTITVNEEQQIEAHKIMLTQSSTIEKDLRIELEKTRAAKLQEARPRNVRDVKKISKEMAT